jgi:enterochelin esterase-like enzyme
MARLRVRPVRRARQGRVVTLQHESRVLRDNPLGDPTTRRVTVYLPADYDRATDRRFVQLWDLVGYTGAGPKHTNWQAFDENVPERLDRLIHGGEMGPAVVVFPDCFTSLGGNQYINSSAIGRYADYLVKELVPFVDRELRTLADRNHRGVFGKSSGGYGAIVHGMKYAKTWGAIADHSGDAAFDLVYRSDFPNVANVLAQYDYKVERFLKAFWRKTKPSGRDVHALMGICMAATYDPDPDAPLGFHLPFDPVTLQVDEARWRKWLKHDPVRMVGRYAANLKSLRGIYIDCGDRDQYHIHFGCRQLSQALGEHGIKHTYEEFPDDHSGIDYRMDRSLPYLYWALQ